METVIYPEARTFLESVQSVLESNEAANSLLLGASLSVARAQDRGSLPFMATVAGNDGLDLVSMMTPPFPLILAEVTKATGSFEVLARRLRDLDLPVTGVVARPDAARDFAEAWGKVSDRSVTSVVRQRIYALREVVVATPSRGELRVAKLEDVPLVARWTADFENEVFGVAAPEGVEEATRRRIDRKEIYLWCDDGPRAKAGRARATRKTVTINSVFTPRDWRGKGFGTAAVSALSQQLLEEGFQECVLYTDLANETSNSIYMKIGYRPVCDSDHLSFT